MTKIYHLPTRPTRKRIKSRSSSKIKINASKCKCRIIALLVVIVFIILILAPKYKRLLDNATALSQHQQQDLTAAHIIISPDAMLRRQQLEKARQQQQQLRQQQQQSAAIKPPLKNIMRQRPPPPPRPDLNNGNGVPFMGVEQFNEKYADKYKGLLPSSERDYPDPICGKRPDFFDFFVLPKTERSRFHEDKIIYDLFKNMTFSPNEESPLPRGTYVELGAFDGKDESNTMFFDKCLGWDGLLIEAQSKSYQQVIQNRPHAIKLSFSPTCKNEGGDETAQFYDYPLSNNGMEGFAKSYAGKQTVEVPCGPLTPVLHDIFGAMGKIDFFSLDVEGAELLVLETIDFSSSDLSIEVIMVEIQNTYCPEANCPGVHEIRRHMAMTRKYALFVDFLEASDVYVRHGTETWRRAMRIVQARKERLEREIREQMAKDRRQLIG